MTLQEFRTAISTRLQSPLPGKQAHDLMLPKRDGRVINLKHREKPRPGAVLILMYEDESGIRFPLIQRPQYEGVHSGQMALPGGKADPTDDSLQMTALREAQEEIGVNPEDVEVIGSLSSFFVSVSNFQILPILATTSTRPQFVPDNHEVAEVVIAHLDHLIDETYVKEKEIVIAGGFSLQSPYFDVDGRTVWGATAMMLSEFSVILKEIYGNSNHR